MRWPEAVHFIHCPIEFRFPPLPHFLRVSRILILSVSRCLRGRFCSLPIRVNPRSFAVGFLLVPVVYLRSLLPSVFQRSWFSPCLRVSVVGVSDPRKSAVWFCISNFGNISLSSTTSSGHSGQLCFQHTIRSHSSTLCICFKKFRLSVSPCLRGRFSFRIRVNPRPSAVRFCLSLLICAHLRNLRQMLFDSC